MLGSCYQYAIEAANHEENKEHKDCLDLLVNEDIFLYLMKHRQFKSIEIACSLFTPSPEKKRQYKKFIERY